MKFAGGPGGPVSLLLKDGSPASLRGAHPLGVIGSGICAECALGRDPAVDSSQACPGMGLGPFVVAFFDVLYRDGA